MGWMHRRGRLELILILPDASHLMVPAAWTDLQATPEPVVFYPGINPPEGLTTHTPPGHLRQTCRPIPFRPTNADRCAIQSP